MNQSATLSPEAVTATEPAPLTALDRCDAGTRVGGEQKACGAQAYVRVTLPSNGTLLFCGHHYKKHAPALASAGASVEDFLHMIPGGNPGASA